MAAKLGFLVVLVDGRGSADRGMAFESWVQGRLGRVEMEDQLRALTWLARTRGMVDVGRVAVTGWSYGGYLSLMAMTEWGHRFRLAIAGAPVTSWDLYDTAYTERYLGLVTPCGDEGGGESYYDAGSLVSKASQFPEEANRVLIVHGLMDENVHFDHTERLVDALVRAGKPHQLQVYPRERHGIRDPTVNEHFETLMFHWLLNYL
ncbi:Alpha/Beta hydrolase protein [Piptocephalis cylindrospora]|uniref:Alpha/Beta hydrolase protein n=1 Tax=Piptocephalis cylindrospora TaxID=1907219 RepID=A0A4V1IYG0_9FUNG|nr:Alpha/Beta hydrolase protein [Piptocephalis cylindrospora]|eukprot:RKP14429.1 Alpha/Beta hydrolase protein [Piptocephalis cylindrospora]